MQRILSSDVFARSERLSAFLQFVVEQTLNGHGGSLKEHVIAIELYGKSADFNTAADPIVRVDARRLRDKLREYYALSPQDRIRISIPKGSYAPVFELSAPSAALVGSSDEHVRPGRRADVFTGAPTRWIAAGVVAAMVFGTWIVMRQRVGQPSDSPTRLLTVTSLPGAEEDPALSPDGNWVAFTWNDTTSTPDLWVKAVDGEAMRRLTDTPDVGEKWPSWSPDGRYVAFTRSVAASRDAARFVPPSVAIVSALGGPERLLAEGAGNPSWFPDGRSLAMGTRHPDGRFGLMQFVIETGERRKLTTAPLGFNDWHPKVSPDGTKIAFARGGEGRTALFLATLDGGAPRQLTKWGVGMSGGLTWTPDGSEILYSEPDMSGRRVVRVAPSGQGTPQPAAGIPHGSLAGSVSNIRGSAGYRIAFVSGQPDIGLRMVDLDGPRKGDALTAVTTFCDATRVDKPGRFSPDGAHVAFVSDRSGRQQVWLARRDGSELRSLTRFDNATLNVGSWSPDARWLAFDATFGGSTDIYILPTEGGPAKRLTNGPANEIDAEWSRDGRWIYYSSDASGRWEIWKMPAMGGTPARITSDGGLDPRESPDGQFLYFVDDRRWHGRILGIRLKRVSAQGGRASVIHSGVYAGAWAVSDAGILFVPADFNRLGGPGRADLLALYDFKQERVRILGELPFPVARFGVDRFLAASRDGRWTLLSHIDRWDRDIMVLDNVR